MSQPPLIQGAIKEPPLLKDSNAQAAALLAAASLAWKLVSISSNISFLLSIRTETFGVMFEFLESIGWALLFLGGVLWLVVIRFRQDKRHQVYGPTWSLIISSAIAAFLFGVLLAVRSSGGVPEVIGAWGAPNGICQAGITTVRLQDFRSRYKLALVCGINDPTTEKLDDERITISNKFELIPGAVQIVAPWSQSMRNYLDQLQRENGNPINVQAWFEAVIVPNDTQMSKITRLRDVMAVGGKIIRPQYYR